MGLLDSLTSGGGGGQFEDFVNRYDQGAPYDGIGDDEALERYQQVDSEIDDDVYHSAARESFSRMQPDERRGFAEQLLGMGGQRGMDFAASAAASATTPTRSQRSPRTRVASSPTCSGRCSVAAWVAASVERSGRRRPRGARGRTRWWWRRWEPDRQGCARRDRRHGREADDAALSRVADLCGSR